MSAMTLRDYQVKQKNFLEENINRAKPEAKMIIGLQSPTGTGKSITILTFIKEYINKPENHGKTVVFSTGFNSLVWQITKDAINMDLNPQVFIGGGLLKPNCETNTCDLTYEMKPTACSHCDKVSYKLDEKGKLCFTDSRPENCSKLIQAKKIREFNSHGGLIITNHAYFLAALNNNPNFTMDLVVFDEAHTMSDFYSSAMSFTENKAIKTVIDSYIKSIDTPTSVVFAHGRANNNLQSKIVENVIKEIRDNKILDDTKIEEFGVKITNLYVSDKDSIIENDENGNVVKYKFFFEYEINCNKIIVLSATIDEYTRRMFNISNSNNIYKQKEPIERYKNSSFLPVEKDFKECFSETISYILGNKENKNGLILCTTLENVEFVYEQINTNYKNVKVYKDIEEFNSDKDSEYKVLVGSKKFFQGIDVPSLNWVWLDKIPFANYDNKHRAYDFYLSTHTKLDPWTCYTMPIMFNNILQASGRLWRVNDYDKNIFDDGLFIISDPRLGKRFKYIIDNFVKSKPGINIVNNLFNNKSEE